MIIGFVFKALYEVRQPQRKQGSWCNPGEGGWMFLNWLACAAGGGIQPGARAAGCVQSVLTQDTEKPLSY